MYVRWDGLNDKYHLTYMNFGMCIKIIEYI